MSVRILMYPSFATLRSLSIIIPVALYYIMLLEDVQHSFGIRDN